MSLSRPSAVAAALAAGDVPALLSLRAADFGPSRMQDDPPVPPAPAPPTDRTFTQAELTAIATREKAEGEKAAIAKVAETLGMSVEDAAKAIKAQRDRDTAAMTEVERREAAATEREQAAVAREQAATAREHQASVRLALREAGIALPTDKADEAMARAVGMVTAQPGADDAAIRAEVEQLKTTWPGMFGATTTTGRPPSTDPGRGPAGQQVKPGDFGADGRAEAERRFAKDRERAAAATQHQVTRVGVPTY